MSNVKSGFVLRLVKTKDYDQIVEIFSRDSGRLSFYSKNSLRPKSKRRQSLEILNLIDFSIPKSKSSQSISILGEVKLVDNFSVLKNVTQSFAEVFIVAEVLNRILPEGTEQEDVFDLLKSCLKLANVDATSLLLFLIINIIDLLGFLPELDICQKTGEKLQATDNIQALFDSPGYYKSTLDSDSSLITQAIKVQKYFLVNRSNPANVVKLALEPRLKRFLFELEIAWVESILDYKLKSKLLLTNFS